MKILVTGAKGFVGKNLCAALQNVADGKDKSRGLDNDIEIMPFDIDTDPALLSEYCQKADFVFNLAGVNRPETEEEFQKGMNHFKQLNIMKTGVEPEFGDNLLTLVTCSYHTDRGRFIIVARQVKDNVEVAETAGA